MMALQSLLEASFRLFATRSLRLAVASLALTVLAVFHGPSLLAGGPVDLTAPGRYGTWDQGRVNFIIDNGPLRSGAITFTRDQGATLIREVTQTWTGVPTSFVTFEDRGFLNVDVNQNNFQMFTRQVRPEGNPVIFDADGSITSTLFGADGSFVLGFASAFLLNQDDFYDYGFVVLNGSQANLGVNGDFRKTVLHEIGHMIGLDHTQAGLEQFFRGPRGFVPIMFPFIVTSSTPAEPRTDDTAWISFLYPEPDFNANFGTIRGAVRRRSGGIFQGANVVAIPVTVPEQGPPVVQNNGFVSVVSDFLFTNDGSYVLPGLPPGNYAVFIEPLESSFVEGSGVGPYDFRFDDFLKDYYNGANESGDPMLDNPSEITVLNVAAGQTIDGINLISNESANDLASLRDDDQELFIFQNGFRFPFFGRLYDSVTVNSDGNLTFQEGDSTSDARGEARFLDRAPRVAPLFTDLNPEQAGSVSSSSDADSLTFIWDGVPEFDGLPEEPNNFRVTLFRSGNILFHYDSVHVTPDNIPPGDDLQAIVGVAPGFGAMGPQIDFSSAQSLRMAASPIYQVFRNADFDLTGTDVLFEAASNQLFLFFPLNEADASNFTGFAVTNDGDEVTLLTVEALAADGQMQPYPDNPHVEGLGGKQQIARLGSDFFGLTSEPQDGWVRMGSTGIGLASFFQFGNGLGGSVTRLDGSTAVTEPSTEFYFTRLYQGAGSFPALSGAQDAETVLAVANPNDEAVTLELTLFDAAGNALGSVQRNIAAAGCLRESVASLFGPAVVSAGFIRARVTAGPGAVGFELVQLADTLLGFNATPFNDQMIAYSAQLANGTAGGLAVFTSVKLVNVANQERTVTLRALASDGTPLAAAVERTLQPNESLQEDAGALFGLGDASAPSVAGSLRVEASGPGIVGDVVFGDPSSIRYAAALPLQTRLFRRAIFSQVANAESNTDQARTFTGLAFHNPGPNPATITVRVFRANGTEAGSFQLQLPAGARVSDILAGLLAASAGQVGGYILIDSTEPVVAQQLFGNFSLDFLSAVPPTIFD